MPKKQETASGRLPSLPEVAVTLQDSSSATTEINLSVEEENALLRERNRQLEATIAAKDAENAILREREIALTRDGIETLNVVTDALRATQPGKETNRFFADSKTRIENASPEDRPFIINARIKAAAIMIRDAPNIAREEGEGRFTYSTRTRTENRALALVEHVKTTGKASIKSTEARAVLETHEGKPLDRKVVLRALEVAQGILRATSDRVGGVTRLILSTPSRRPSPASPQERESHNRIGGGGGGLSRPRGWAVPWDGVD